MMFEMRKGREQGLERDKSAGRDSTRPPPPPSRFRFGGAATEALKKEEKNDKNRNNYNRSSINYKNN